MRRNDINDYALPFAAWELRLYLDTHPNDERALAAYRQLCAAQGHCTYACATSDGKTSVPTAANENCSCRENNRQIGNVKNVSGASVWTWIDDPWPWEPEANVIGGNC